MQVERCSIQSRRKRILLDNPFLCDSGPSVTSQSLNASYNFAKIPE